MSNEKDSFFKLRQESDVGIDQDNAAAESPNPKVTSESPNPKVTSESPNPKVTSESQSSTATVQESLFGRFRVTSVRSHIFVEPDVLSKFVGAAVKGNLLTIKERVELPDGLIWYRVIVPGKDIEGFVESIRGKVI